MLKAAHQTGNIPYCPAIVGKIATAYFRTLVLRRPTLRVCEFSIASACQASCRFCYASKFTKRGEHLLTLDEIRQTWKQAQKLGAFNALVLGGEPLLHPQFLDIVQVLDPRRNIVTFTTNGIALTEPLLLELKRLGVFLVNVSINSLDRQVNDYLRGYDGYLDAAMRAIELCRKHGLRVTLPVGTARPYLDETKRIVEFAKARNLGVTVNLLCPAGRAEGHHEDLFDDVFWTELRRLYRSYAGLRSDFDVNLDLRIGCPSGFEKIHIGPYGDVTGCSMQPFSFGNVRETPLENVVSRMRRFHHFAKRSPTCLVAVDWPFIADYMDHAVNYPATPYPVEANPHYAADAGPADA